MKSSELKKSYIEFFKKKGHKEIPNFSLIPENDPTVLFTTAGMHPLVPFLIGEKHHLGKRLINIQRCLRTGDISEVGDNVHLTFFEMLGNWSLGDYWKKEAIGWSYEFLTKVLKYPKEKLAVSIFKGDKDAPLDKESMNIWLKLGITKDKIALLGKEDNWWGPAGETGPCGPDTEMFYWNSNEKIPKKFNPKNSRWVEVWNDVFMEYNKTKDDKYISLKQKNVDTGFGFERNLAILEGKENIYETSLFKPILDKIRDLSKAKNLKSERIIADHLRASVFILMDGVVPSNIERGYVLRRLIRNAIRHGRILGINKNFTKNIAEIVIKNYSNDYNLLEKNKKNILEELEKEENKFRNTLEKGLNKFEKFSKNKIISSGEAFLLFQSFGFPIEMTMELAKDKKIKVDLKGYEQELGKHQELSRTATKGRFKSGLADHSEKTTRLHTATHLLLAALKKVLKTDIHQKGSNITPERLRFDFSFERRITEEELKKVEDLVNEQIRKNIDVKRAEMS